MTKSNYQFFEPLYQKYSKQGFEIAAFPCNQFGAQEPFDNDKIKDAVFKKTGIAPSFDMYSKIDVKGDNIDPLFKYLTECAANEKTEIRWNFDGKFLIDTTGQCIQRWHAKVPLEDIEKFIADKLKGNKL